MKTQKVSRKKRTFRKKRTYKRRMIGGRRLSRNDVAYLKSMRFQIVEPEPDDDDDYDDDDDENFDDDEVRFAGYDDGTATWSDEVYDEIGTHLEDSFLDTVIDFAGFVSLAYLRQNYSDGYIPYFNERWKSTQAFYQSLSGFFLNGLGDSEYTRR